MVNTCTGTMLASNEEFKQQAFADSCPPWLTVIFSGIDQEGRPFTTLAMDSSGGGTGARTYRDGIDTGGGLDIPGMSMADVEMEEYNSPVLVLWRKEVRDTFGPGKFRGGVGIEWAKIPHKNPAPIQCVIATTSVAMPGAAGICGGLPCSTQFAAIVRKTEVRRLLKSGKVPSDLSEAGGNVQIMPAKAFTSMDNDDVQFAVRGGGGGYADPLDRDPENVERDVRDGLCSLELAREIFGVIIEPKSSGVDKAATEKRREEIRQERLKEGKSVHHILSQKNKVMVPPKSEIEVNKDDAGGVRASKEIVMPIGEAINVVRQRGELLFECARCGYIYGSTGMGDPKKEALMREVPIGDLNSWNKFGWVDEFVVREYYCPECGVMIAANVQRKNEDIVMDYNLNLA